jgi:hypothetical protein
MKHFMYNNEKNQDFKLNTYYVIVYKLFLLILVFIKTFFFYDFYVYIILLWVCDISFFIYSFQHKYTLYYNCLGIEVFSI